MNKKAKQILQKADIDKLPSLPHVLLNLLDACNGESPPFTELAVLLKQDPCLYAMILSACSRNQSINERSIIEPGAFEDSFEQDLQQLGVNAIKSIIVTSAVRQFFSSTRPERTRFLKQHWHHSLYCAIVAESIARLINYKNPNEAYSAGLLHDIGQLVLETAYPDKYISMIAQLSEDENINILEQSEFGTTHQEVGALLLTEHGANGFICDAVLYHHESIESIIDAHPLVKIVSLANKLTSIYTGEYQQFYDDAERLLGISAELPQLLEKAKQRIAGISKKLEIGMIYNGADVKAIKQQDAGDELKQAQLAEQVRNIALLDGIHQQLSRSSGRSEGKDTLINIILQNVAVLFGVSQSILFIYDTASDRVNAVSADNQPPQLADISIALTAGRSLVTDALLKQEVCHSFNTESFEHNLNKKISIVDQQLIGIMRQEGILCLPMIMNNVAIGTLVLGVNQIQYNNLWKQLPLLSRFANEIGQIISIHNLTGIPAASARQQRTQLEQRIHEVLHEVRNPLSIMNNYLGILSYKLENDKTVQEDVQTIKSEIERVSQILSRLIQSESSKDETSAVDINAIIMDLTRIFQTSLFASKNIQISLDLDERIKSLQCNANSIKQIYTNLIKNAVEALDANGQIMVYTQDYVNVDGEDHIEISVADNGPGISVDILPRLFSPIETTKGENHAGLGLTIVKNLVNELHGSISCRSSDKGTGFYILLPKHPKKTITAHAANSRAVR
ncbi:MAG: HDOD domain-containing protein [Gammaproteobacteria bacterium]|nr:HDOD domain-containing protein [Gammaproteobacteria bacterium]